MAVPSAPRAAHRLGRGSKIGYGAADIGASLTFATINTWLLYFLINIARLEPLAAGVVFIAGRLFDALLDPVMGVISDRLRGRWGRLRFVRWGALPLGISFALLWLPPTLAPGLAPRSTLLLALGLFMLFSLLYTVVQVPYLALTPELAPEYDERTSLSSYRVAFGTLASLLAVAAPPLVVVAVSGPGELATSAPQGWLAMGVLFGLLAALSYLVTAFTVREPPPTPVNSSASTGTGAALPSLLHEYRSAFRIFGFAHVFWLFITITVGIMIVASMLPFYLESALGLGAAQQPLVLGTLFLVAIAVMPAWTALGSRLGKRRALMLGLALLASATLLLVAFAPPGGLSPTLLSLTTLAGVGLSATLLFPWAMLPDVVEFDQLEHGRRREGLVYALFTFGQKIAGSIGVFANAIVASVFGYQLGSAVQAPTTILGIRLMVGPAAAAVFLVALLLAWRFPITRAVHRQAQQRLAAGGKPH